MSGRRFESRCATCNRPTHKRDDDVCQSCIDADNWNGREAVERETT